MRRQARQTSAAQGASVQKLIRSRLDYLALAPAAMILFAIVAAVDCTFQGDHCRLFGSYEIDQAANANP
jgi:hypothetical protein